MSRRFNWQKWLDEFVFAGKGILLATKEKRFWNGFVPAFFFFGFLMNLLSGGFSKFELMSALGFPESLKILGNSFISIFGVNQPFLDWLPIFALSILQGILIGLIVLLWNKKKEQNSKNNNSLPSSILRLLIKSNDKAKNTKKRINNYVIPYSTRRYYKGRNNNIIIDYNKSVNLNQNSFMKRTNDEKFLYNTNSNL